MGAERRSERLDPSGSGKRAARPRLLVWFVVLAAALAAVVSVAAPGAEPEAPPLLTLDPTPISLAEPEIANPWRGSFLSNDRPPSPPGWPVVDSYRRTLSVYWRTLEPERDAYDFSAIEDDLADAARRAGKHGIRIVSADTQWGQASVPGYLMELMPGGFWFTHSSSGKSTYAPDWNDPDYVERARALLMALGRRYGSDTRLGWIEMGLYGDFAEWHVWRWPYNPSPTGATPGTSATKRALVDAHVAAFPGKRLISMKDDGEAFDYALGLSPRIGWRNDCLGDAWFTDGMRERFAANPAAAERWKTAPVLAEYCYRRPGDGGFARSVQQVRDFHVAMVGNGNMASWSTFSATEQAAFVEANKRAGYRFVLNRLALPGRLAPGAPFAVEASWSNVGGTPAYHPWRTRLQLRDGSGSVVWQADSVLDLERLLPTTNSGTGIDTPVVVRDSFVLPSTLAFGTYQLALLVADPEGYYRPLALAIGGRAADGSYPLGSITVGR